ncbi:MAG: type 2 isopentenyl-diphosphate Delta-isomerase [Deinococcota bacterium]|nr:type 2 isopentenyl-diphosphate Delta-isomerase [Deinococcota bacterium]
MEDPGRDGGGFWLEERKRKHVEVCLTHPVNYETRTTGFEGYDLPYLALPETDLTGIDTETIFLGKTLQAPLLIGAMTGGAEFAERINKNLAQAAQRLGIGLMLGSQRIMLEHDAAISSFAVRPYARNVLLIGNLGLAQLNKGYGYSEIMRAIELIEADALALHTNPLQEALQLRGDTDFSGLVAKLHGLVPKIPYPLMLKEVGHGLSARVAEGVREVGFSALDVAGAGGTSWARVEEFVYYGEIRHKDLAEWGIPTSQALAQVHKVLPEMPLVASGGIRSGLDAVKAIALGAQVVAVARPLLAPALESAEAVVNWLEHFIWELKVAMHCSGAADLEALRTINLIRH